MLTSSLCLFLCMGGVLFSSFQLLSGLFLLMGVWLGVLSFILEYSFYLGGCFLFLDKLSYVLVFLSIILIFYVIVMDFSGGLYYLFFFLLVILYFSFLVNNFFMLFLFFEFSLVPLVFLLFIQGGSMERFNASFYLFMYTYASSLMFLLVLVNLSKSCMVSVYYVLYMNCYSGVYWFLGVLVFLVKLPVYGLHFWLPKAHVEASVVGSMILAGILLKLGGYGLIRFLMLVNSCFIKFCLDVGLGLSLVGALLSGFICLRQVDIKMLIAYSSVSHMSLMLGGVLTLLKLGLCGAMGLMLSHGFCSSGLFFMSGVLYFRVKTRSLCFYSGLVHLFPLFMVFWLLFNLMNAGCPPFLSFFCEVFIVFSLLKKSLLVFFILLFIMMISVLYSVCLFLRVGHGFLWACLLIFEFESFSEILVISMHFLFQCIFYFKLSFFLVSCLYWLYIFIYYFFYLLFFLFYFLCYYFLLLS